MDEIEKLAAERLDAMLEDIAKAGWCTIQNPYRVENYGGRNILRTREEAVAFIRAQHDRLMADRKGKSS